MLWLHGHTSLAANPEWRVKWGATTLVNVTGAVLVELGVDQTTRPGAVMPGATIGARGAAGST
jgi:hypothetical protein